MEFSGKFEDAKRVICQGKYISISRLSGGNKTSHAKRNLLYNE